MTFNISGQAEPPGHLKEVIVEAGFYPPYFDISESGKVSGISYYVANEIFKRAGYKAIFKVLPYKRAVHNLFNNKNGVMMGVLAGIPEFQKLNLTEISYLIFPTTYFYNSKLNSKYSRITKIEQTKGLDVLVMGGTGFYENIITESGGKAIKVSRDELTLSMLQSGRADFAHTGLFSGLDNIKKNPKYKDLVPLPFNATSLTGGIVFREVASNSRDAFLKTVKEMYMNGDLLVVFKFAFQNYPRIDYKKMLPSQISVKRNTAK